MTQFIWPDSETKSLEELTLKFCDYPNPIGAECVVAVIPLYTSDAVDNITRIDKMCRGLSFVKSLHILGLRGSLAPAISGNVVAAHSEAEHKAIRKLPGLSLSELNVSYSLIENADLNGEHVGFTPTTLARYLAQVLKTFYLDFHAVASPALLSEFQGWNLAIGTSALKFNIPEAIGLIKSRAFREAINKSGFPTQTPTGKGSSQFDIPYSDFRKFLQEVAIHTLRQTNSLKETLAKSKSETEKYFSDLTRCVSDFVFSKNVGYKERESVISEFLVKLSEFKGFARLTAMPPCDGDMESRELTKINSRIDNSEKQLSQLTAKIEELRKHPFLNFRRIKKLVDEEADLQNSLNRLRRELQETEVIAQVSEMWDSAVNELINLLQNYQSALSQFCRDMDALYSEIALPEKPTEYRSEIVLNDDNLLLQFYASKKETLLSLIDIPGTFKKEVESRLDIEALKETLTSKFMAVIRSLFSSFSIAEYLMGQDYPYLKPADCRDMLGELWARAIPTSHSSAPELPTPEMLSFVGTDVQRLRAWKAATDNLQPGAPQSFINQDPSEIILLKIQPIPYEYCR